MSNSFLDETYKLIEESDLTQREIAEGAGVSYWWYIKFAQRSIRDPGVKNTQIVHDFLAARAKAA